MSRTYRHNKDGSSQNQNTAKDYQTKKQTRSKASSSRNRADRQIRVRAVRRTTIDMRRLSRALISLAQAEAEAAAQRTSKNEDSASAKDNGEDAK